MESKHQPQMKPPKKKYQPRGFRVVAAVSDKKGENCRVGQQGQGKYGQQDFTDMVFHAFPLLRYIHPMQAVHRPGQDAALHRGDTPKAKQNPCYHMPSGSAGKNKPGNQQQEQRNEQPPAQLCRPAQQKL